jgi:threonine/homoserine/homoserine lactone efflux protein
MDLLLLAQGLVIGFAIAAPVGPIGVLCISRTLNRGRVSGLATGLGAATADGVYGCVAGFGVTIISNFLVHQQTWFRLVGGLFLVYLGIRELLAKPSADSAATPNAGLFSDYRTTFFLTLTNPMTIVSFAAVFASVGLGESNYGYGKALSLILGIFSGSALWWFLLSFAVAFFFRNLGKERLLVVNRLAGIVIAGFGAVVLGSLVVSRP